MAKMKIQISKDDFEQSILAATSSHSEVFESVEPHFRSPICGSASRYWAR